MAPGSGAVACLVANSASAAPSTTRWPPHHHRDESRPSSAQRRTVSALTPSSSAACPIRTSLTRQILRPRLVSARFRRPSQEVVGSSLEAGYGHYRPVTSGVRPVAARSSQMAEFSLELNEDQQQIQKWVHDFAEQVVRPAAHEWDEREETPWPLIEEAAKIGLYSWSSTPSASPTR